MKMGFGIPILKSNLKCVVLTKDNIDGQKKSRPEAALMKFIYQMPM